MVVMVWAFPVTDLIFTALSIEAIDINTEEGGVWGERQEHKLKIGLSTKRYGRKEKKKA